MSTFKASDGTTFETRAERNRYEFETFYTFKNKTGETLAKELGSIQGQPFDLADLTDCTVVLPDHSDQIQVDNLTNCRVFVGASSESVFVRNCTGCTFTAACKQLRTRDCTNCDFYLYCQTDPIIETSSNMRFANFNGAFPNQAAAMASAGLDPANNHWSAVFDFNDEARTGVNWSYIPVGEEAPLWAPCGDAECPVPRSEATGGAPVPGAPDASGMQSFSIHTSQEAAQAAVEAAAPAAEDQPPAPPAAAAAPATAPVPTSEAGTTQLARIAHLWDLLQRGVTVLKHREGQAEPNERALWLTGDGFKLHLERTKMSDEEMAAHIAHRGNDRGLPLGDITAVTAVEGGAPRMHIVTAARTFDVSLPDVAARDELAGRLTGLLANIDALRAAVVLQRGLEVRKHFTAQAPQMRVFWLSQAFDRFHCERAKASDAEMDAASAARGRERGVLLSAVTGVQVGAVSDVFNASPEKNEACCLTVAAPVHTFSIELATTEARDTLAQQVAAVLDAASSTSEPGPVAGVGAVAGAGAGADAPPAPPSV